MTELGTSSYNADAHYDSPAGESQYSTSERGARRCLGPLQDEEYQRWAGSVWGSHYGRRSKPVVVESFVQDGDGGAVLKSGGGVRAEGCNGELSAPMYLDTINCGGIGDDLRLFSPSELLFTSPSQPLQQAASARISRHGFLGLNRQSSGRLQSDTPLPVHAGFRNEPVIERANSVNDYAQAYENLQLRCGDRHNGLSRALDSSASDGVLTEVEADPPSEFKEEWANGTNLETENWRKFGDFVIGEVKREESENIQVAGHILDGVMPRQKPIPGRLQGLPEDYGASGSTSQSDSDSEESKKEALSRKRKRAGHDADGNVTWTDESVRFLFEAYDAIHQRLWEESKGQVKYQKKWTPILKAMQARFGNHFTKKQCQSKYWSVRRECSEYRITSAKAAATDPLWNPSIAGRELLKPKFYNVWLEVSGKNLESMVTKTTGSAGSREIAEQLKGKPSNVLGREMQPVKQRISDSSAAIKKMQRLMLEQLQASDEREEVMKHSAELMMNLLTQHIEHVETRVTFANESQAPQLHLLEVIDFKLEKVLEGFSTLNQNLSLLYSA
nr:uncharacterized protein LOC112279798 [Physcomitrium patens]|eukprot:XP_024370267.1 uncharacterized protein LOC112279798 [Physcomitrella patens]